MAQRGGPGARKRGHQHHPLNSGSRRRAFLISEPDVPEINNITSHHQSKTVKQSSSGYCDAKVVQKSGDNNATTSSSKLSQDITPIKTSVIKSACYEAPESKVIDWRSVEEEFLSKQSKKNLNEAILYMSLVDRPEAEGSSQSDQEAEDAEVEELSRLRCPSERTEVVAERETRRRNRRCADYPGLAFGSSIFSSDTLMKFSIIRNELHNIMNTQLKRVGAIGCILVLFACQINNVNMLLSCLTRSADLAPGCPIDN